MDIRDPPWAQANFLPPHAFPKAQANLGLIFTPFGHELPGWVPSKGPVHNLLMQFQPQQLPNRSKTDIMIMYIVQMSHVLDHLYVVSRAFNRKCQAAHHSPPPVVPRLLRAWDERHRSTEIAE